MSLKQTTTSCFIALEGISNLTEPVYSGLIAFDPLESGLARMNTGEFSLILNTSVKSRKSGTSFTF